jgi:hypothetical protein
MKFPLIVLDFEANTLIEKSLPIEVGVAVVFRARADPSQLKHGKSRSQLLLELGLRNKLILNWLAHTYDAVHRLSVSGRDAFWDDRN